MDGWLKGALGGGIRNAKKRAGSCDAGFPSQAARSLELPAVERPCRGAAPRIWAAFPGVLVGKAPVILTAAELNCDRLKI